MKHTVLAIIQARMGSSRLPGKMLLPLFKERGALEIMLSRMQQAQTLAHLIVATTNSVEDDALAALCKKAHITCFRGSKDDVLDRFYQAAVSYGTPDVIVRLTGDCPLHDPEIVDEVVRAFLEANVDYMSNIHPPTYPDGLDTEVCTFQSLEQAWKEATLPSDREHVTPFIWRQPHRFRQGNVVNSEDLSSLRWTLDEIHDVEFLRRCFAELGDHAFGMRDVLKVLKDNPELLDFNAGISRNEGYEKSLREDTLCADQN